MTTNPDDPSRTSLPLFSTWPRLYLLVTLVFACYVLLLSALSRAFR